MVDFELDFLELFGFGFKLVLASEDFQLVEQLLLYQEALKSPLGGAFGSFGSALRLVSEILVVFGLQNNVCRRGR
jgi:hypothetical protein